MAIPAVWHQDESAALASSAAMVLAGANPQGPGCLTAGRGERHGDAREGLLLRGSGSAHVGPAGASVALRVRTITYWSGTRTRTIDTRTGQTPRLKRRAKEATYGRA